MWPCGRNVRCLPIRARLKGRVDSRYPFWRFFNGVFLVDRTTPNPTSRDRYTSYVVGPGMEVYGGSPAGPTARDCEQQTYLFWRN
jgi:hypothetical protein